MLIKYIDILDVSIQNQTNFFCSQQTFLIASMQHSTQINLYTQRQYVSSSKFSILAINMLYFVCIHPNVLGTFKAVQFARVLIIRLRNCVFRGLTRA